MAEVPIAFESYQSRSAPFSAQRLVNLYWESPPQIPKSPGILFKRPAKTTFATVGSGNIRGIHTMKGVPFIVSGEEIYTLNSDATSTLLGTVPGTDFVDMDDNGEEVAIAAEGNGYIATLLTVTQITDVSFRQVSSVVYQDSFFIWTEAGTGRFFKSAALDGFTYDALEFATAEFAPDNLVKAFSDHDDLFLLGKDTIEPWDNAGTADFPFIAIGGAVMEVGLLARDTVEKLDNSIVWLGSSERGGRIVWRANGYTPQRISTHALESKWDEVTDPEDAYSISFEIEGHAFYVLTFPSTGTYVYDAATNLWCEWIVEGQSDWSAIGFSNAFGKRLVGDPRSNIIHSLAVDVFSDDGADIRWEATSPPLFTENNELARHHFVRIDMEAGVGLTSGQGSDPQIFLEWSDEDAETFGNKHLLNVGKQGKKKTRVFKRKLGIARSRIYRISGTDPVKTAILGGYADVRPGRW